MQNLPGKDICAVCISWTCFQVMNICVRCGRVPICRMSRPWSTAPSSSTGRNTAPSCSWTTSNGNSRKRHASFVVFFTCFIFRHVLFSDIVMQKCFLDRFKTPEMYSWHQPNIILLFCKHDSNPPFPCEMHTSLYLDWYSLI